MPLFLTSLVFDGLDEFLASHAAGGPVWVITNASRELDDQDAIVSIATDAIAASGREPVLLDVTAREPAALAEAGAIVMTGGDPFRLLADLRASGADALLREAASRNVPIVGQSAGAIVCGPTLAPVRITSPFPAPDHLDLAGQPVAAGRPLPRDPGLGLTDYLVLPHHGRPGRSALHRQAAQVHAPTPTMTVLWDDETMICHDSGWQIRRASQRTRPAQATDAAAIGEVFHQAALAAWAPFLGRDRVQRQRQDDALWAERIDGTGRFLVTEDTDGLAGFVYWREHDAATGEVDLLYTQPRAWGGGIGRRLLERATWQLLDAGYREAILWTEARNERAQAVYRANGWVPDGATQERDYAGAPIRNLRYRLDLTRYAGGA